MEIGVEEDAILLGDVAITPLSALAAVTTRPDGASVTGGAAERTRLPAGVSAPGLIVRKNGVEASGRMESTRTMEDAVAMTAVRRDEAGEEMIEKRT